MADKRELLHPVQIEELAHSVAAGLREALEALNVREVKLAWAHLSESDLFGDEELLEKFDLNELRGDIRLFLFVMEYIEKKGRDTAEDWMYAMGEAVELEATISQAPV